MGVGKLRSRINIGFFKLNYIYNKIFVKSKAKIVMKP